MVKWPHLITTYHCDVATITTKNSAIATITTKNTVSEIKGVPCTRRAHFHGRVHDFKSRAPGVCTFFEPFIIAIYWEGAWSNFRVHSFMSSAPCECTKQKLNFGH